MASSWLNSWGGSWGNSWGVRSLDVDDGGGGPSKKKKRARKLGEVWARENVFFKPEPQTSKPVIKKIKAPIKDYSQEFIGAESLCSDIETLQEQINTRRIEAQARGVEQSRIADDEEAMLALFLAIEYEKQAFQIAFNI